MQLSIATLTLAILSTFAFSQSPSPSAAPDNKSSEIRITEESPVRNINEYDLNKKKDNLAIDGYDPVAYFPESGSKATKGSKKITYTYKQVTYRFSNEDNKKLFIANPARYEPAYGGWCAWAMSRGSKTEINPKTFIVKEGRLYLFYNGLFGNTKDDWEKGSHTELSTSADDKWLEISGESPRTPPESSDS